MAKKTRRPRNTGPVDTDDLAARLASQDAQVRLAALRQSCPCRAGFRVYEQVRVQVGRLAKDPDPAIRQQALHILDEACRIEEKETRLDWAEETGVRVGDPGWTAAQVRRRATGTWEPL